VNGMCGPGACLSSVNDTNALSKAHLACVINQPSFNPTEFAILHSESAFVYTVAASYP